LITLDEARAAFHEQISALIEGGVDLIIIETMMDLNEAHQALLAAREVGHFPVVVQFTVQADGSTPTGTSAEDFARALDEWGADLIGVNCSVGPAGVQETLERIAAVTAKRLSAQPNAGLPRTVEGRSLYLCSPEYMASYARSSSRPGPAWWEDVAAQLPSTSRPSKPLFALSAFSGHALMWKYWGGPHTL
jgi:methionine synthase / methylenetetrahydrofolate reductase(NADPH)